LQRVVGDGGVRAEKFIVEERGRARRVARVETEARACEACERARARVRVLRLDGRERRVGRGAQVLRVRQRAQPLEGQRLVGARLLRRAATGGREREQDDAERDGRRDGDEEEAACAKLAQKFSRPPAARA
jgi:hypothetical protein